MRHILVIHGGDCFATDAECLAYLSAREFPLSDLARTSWKKSLATHLTGGYEVLLPRMPNPENAKYDQWRVVFEKYLAQLTDKAILIGHSLGGIFLAKYFSETPAPHRSIAGLFLVAAPHSDEERYSLESFRLGGSVAPLAHRCANVFLYHSSDDPVVPFEELSRYQAALPNAYTRIFNDRGHFNAQEFPELLQDIRSV